MFLPKVPMNIEHDPVDSSFVFVKFFKQEICNKNSAEKKESVHTRKCVQNRLESVRVHQL